MWSVSIELQEINMLYLSSACDLWFTYMLITSVRSFMWAMNDIFVAKWFTFTLMCFQLAWRSRLNSIVTCIHTSDIIWGRSEQLCIPSSWSPTRVLLLRPWPRLLGCLRISLTCECYFMLSCSGLCIHHRTCNAIELFCFTSGNYLGSLQLGSCIARSIK